MRGHEGFFVRGLTATSHSPMPLKATVVSSGVSTKIQNAMNLLIDTDAFCKLGIAGRWSDSTKRPLAANTAECGRLPGLEYRLRKGALRKRYGEMVCAELIPIAQPMQVMPAVDNSWLEKLAPIDEIDPGEVQI